MNRSIPSIPAWLSAALAAVAVSCGPPSDASDPGRADVADDSPMVVTSESGVPSDDRPTVVFLGTSLTAGLGLASDEDGWVARLESIADSSGTPFRAINAGVSGETSAGGLRRLDWVLREPVDVLVVELGANDGLRGQSPEALEENLVEIVRRARTRNPGIEVILAGMEAPPNLGDVYTSAFRQVFPTVAEAEGTELVPFLLVGVAGVDSLNQSDRIHPTPDGHRMIAATVWPTLRSVLDRLTSRQDTR